MVCFYNWDWEYLLLVFTRSVDSNCRAFWLAPVTRNILGYSLFCERREKWRVVSWKFQKKKLKKRFFYPYDLVNTKTTIPSGSVKSGRYTYLHASRLGIYPPLFTSPSGDSCLLFSYSMGHIGKKNHNTLPCPPKFCASIVCVFSWDHL